MWVVIAAFKFWGKHFRKCSTKTNKLIVLVNILLRFPVGGEKTFIGVYLNSYPLLKTVLNQYSHSPLTFLTHIPKIACHLPSWSCQNHIQLCLTQIGTSVTVPSIKTHRFICQVAMVVSLNKLYTMFSPFVYILPKTQLLKKLQASIFKLMPQTLDKVSQLGKGPWRSQ